MSEPLARPAVAPRRPRPWRIAAAGLLGSVLAAGMPTRVGEADSWAGEYT